MNEVVNEVGFDDLDSGSSGLATVRRAASAVAIGLSLSDDGDVEVFMTPATAQRFAELIAAAARESQT